MVYVHGSMSVTEPYADTERWRSALAVLAAASDAVRSRAFCAEPTFGSRTYLTQKRWSGSAVEDCGKPHGLARNRTLPLMR